MSIHTGISIEQSYSYLNIAVKLVVLLKRQVLSSANDLSTVFTLHTFYPYAFTTNLIYRVTVDKIVLLQISK